MGGGLLGRITGAGESGGDKSGDRREKLPKFII